MKIREELVYVRGKVDSMKSDLVLQMQVLIMSTLTFYISTHHGQHGMLSHHDQRDTGGIEDIISFTLTEQLPIEQSNDVHGEIQQGSETAETEMYVLESEASSSDRQDNYNEINGHRQPETAAPIFLSAGRFLRRILPRIFPTRLKTSSYMEFELLVNKIQPSAIEFTGKELRNATKGFGEELGKGGFGTVYFGTLLDGRKVAVKLIVRKGKEEWWEKELAVLTRKHHPNVVKLVGYCFKGDLMLVYEYMAGGNLSDLLLQGESQQIIDWHTRMKIIYDIIEGLVYLHEGAGGCVVHRDIKPNNILLDENFNAKIADFGISYILTDDTQYAHEETWTESGIPLHQYFQEETHVSTGLAGTLGYIDPEYVLSGRLTNKTDIYSFGMLLLNVVSGKKSIQLPQDTDEELRPLVDHAWRLHKEDRLNELIDPRLVNNNGLNSSNESNLNEILRTMKIALWCIQRESKLRPSASQVLRMLSFEEEIPIAAAPMESYHDYSDDTWSSSSASLLVDEDQNLSALEIEETTSLL